MTLNLLRAGSLCWVIGTPEACVLQAIKTLSAVFLPTFYAAKAAAWLEGVNEMVYQVIYGLLFYGWLILLIANVGQKGLWALAWVCYLFFAVHMAYVRATIRGCRVRLKAPLSHALVSLAALSFTLQLASICVVALPCNNTIRYVAAWGLQCADSSSRVPQRPLLLCLSASAAQQACWHAPGQVPHTHVVELRIRGCGRPLTVGRCCAESPRQRGK